MRFSGLRLKKARESKEISRDDLSMDLAVRGFRITGRSIANWEDGRSNPSVDALMALSKYFNKELVYFFDQNVK